MTLDLRADRALIRTSGRSVRYVLAGIEAPAAPARDDHQPVNLAFVIDRSGSMHGEKIALAREGALAGIRSLGESDRFSVVVYDHEVEVMVPSTVATTAAKREAAQIIRRVDARGSTDLAGGWLAGCAEIERHLSPSSVARCLLLTDGLANVGITDPEELVLRAAGFAARGIATSTFGVGRDYNEDLLEQMATAGAGNYYFIESAVQIPDFLSSEVGEALEVVARDVVLEVEAAEGVTVTSLNDLEPVRREGSGGVAFGIGPLVSEQLYDAVLRLRFPAGADGDQLAVRCTLRDADGTLGRPSGRLEFTFAGHRRNDAQPRDHEVDRAVAAVYAALARQTALERNRAGEFDGATQILVETAVRIRSYAAGDREMLAWADGLELQQHEFGRHMSSIAAKRHHSLHKSALKNRMMDGKARRKWDDRRPI